MYLRTKYNLLRIKRGLSPSAVFKAHLQKDLNKAWNAKYGKVSWFQTGVLYKVGAIAVAVLVLVGSGGVYAYSSPDVTEGNILYPAKKAIERIEEITKITPEAKAKFYLKKIERREAEKEKLEAEVGQRVKKLERFLPISADVDTDGQAKITITAEDRNDVASVQIGKDARNIDIERRIKKTERSLEQAEDQLDRFSKNIEKFDKQQPKFRPEIRSEIEGRLQIRKQRLEKASVLIQQRIEKQDQNSTEIEVEQSDEAQSESTEDTARVRLELRNRLEFNKFR